MNVFEISPARLVFNEAGIPYSSEYQDVYHSADGAWQQAQHVFLAGNQLPTRWQQQAQFVILETGFGLGINFLATWAAWRAHAQRPAELHFVSIEKHPLPSAELAQALAASLRSLIHNKEINDLSQALVQQWPVLTPGMHRLCFEEGKVVLTLVLGDVTHMLGRLQLGVDAFYLDGFAPSKNPQMWSLPVLQMLGRYAREHATLATYSCAAQVQAHLRTAGFVMRREKGFSSKRHMLVGEFAPPWRKRRYQPLVVQRYPIKTAVVIGTGIAGATVAAALARQGWEVTVFERAAHAAQATSAHSCASIHPLLTRDDNQAARALRAGYWQALKEAAIQRSGCLQVALNAEQAQAWQAMLMQLKLDSQYACWVDAQEAEALSGAPQPFGGIWYAQAGWADIAALCRQRLQTPGIRTFFNTVVTRLRKRGEVWCIEGETSTGTQKLMQAPVVILANAMGALALLQASHLLSHEHPLPLTAVRGQISFAQLDQNVHWPHAVLCGHGYLLPCLPSRGRTVIFGATYDEGDSDLAVRHSSHEENLQKLSTLLPDVKREALQIQGGFTAHRCVSPDRLPLIGAWRSSVTCAQLDEEEKSELNKGLYTVLGLGSRGLIWSALAAEILTSAVTGAPAPVEADLLRALDPSRFFSQEKS